MSAKSILGNDFQFNRIRFNTQDQGKYFEKSIQLNALDELNFHDGSRQTTAYTGQGCTGCANWSESPAVSNVDFSTYGIQDSSASLGATGQFLSSQGGELLWADTPAPPDPSNWSDFPAVSNVDFSTYGIQDSSASLGATGQFLSSQGGELLWADTPAPPDPSNWSDFPAVSNIVCSTYGIQDSTSSLGATGQLLSSQGSSLVWVDPPAPILTTQAPSGSNYLLANGQNVYDNAVLIYTRDGSGAQTITASNSIVKISSTTSDDTATLLNTSLVFVNPSTATSGLSTNSLYFNDGVGRKITIDGTSSIITVQDSAGAYSGIYDYTRIYFREYSSGTQGSFSRNSIQFENSSGYSNLAQSVLVFNNITYNTVLVNGSDSTLTLFDGTNTAILSPTNITFNGASLVSAVGTNTSNIATNTTNIATNTGNIATNTTNISTLQIKQISSINQYISAAIYADAKPPLPPTTTITQTYAYSPAWYFKNSFATNNKINWYVGGDIGATVADVLGLYMGMFNGANTSNDNCPFITFYTQPQVGDPTFYHSKRTYLFNQTVTPVANTRYLMFQNMTGTCPTPFHYGATLNNMQLSPVAGSNVGPFLPTELVLAFAIGTNSAAALNAVEFATNKFGIMTASGTQELLFIPST